MSEPPRSPKEPLVNHWMVALIALVSLFSGLSALALFWFVYSSTGELILARSVAFATLGINSLAYVFSIRTLKEPIWKVNPTNNIWLILGVMGGVVLQLAPFVFGPAQSFFGVTVIPIVYWGYIVAVTLVMIVLIELAKVFVR
jgi:Ca2+-transporting ATPase